MVNAGFLLRFTCYSWTAITTLGLMNFLCLLLGPWALYNIIKKRIQFFSLLFGTEFIF